ncbi:hypothetical protein I2492_13380 [Budviciaceae bacterium CWB-B4]|uniref:Uncharacterized protein n=1 Tax=Limnobaculum xujianqingii TaxID=2738837 RepID=A0A9D7AJH4_9GAMM|nr:hypothetical protein [Limnobaculum xujianqingii]MBK5073795.1 hypothetical protein [Limnobaculum xujianqingii]MBK5177311.1 hypothetical protein [Limnobaculum xujianqingii]
MSIGIMIDEPKNEEEKSFFIPVATEKTFNEYWLIAAQELKLQWVPIFSTGVVVDQDDLLVVINELNAIRIWIMTHITNIENQKELLNRIDYIIKKLFEIVKNKDIKLYIG